MRTPTIDPDIRFSPTGPGRPLGAFMFTTAEQAWAAAATTALDRAREQTDPGVLDGDLDHVAQMLRAQDPGDIGAWSVSRHATTVCQAHSPGLRLSEAWSGALRLQEGGIERSHTYMYVVHRAVIAAVTVAPRLGALVAVATDRHLITGVVYEVEDGELRFCDGHSVAIYDTALVAVRR